MGTCGDCKSFEPKQLVGICSLSQGVTRSTWHCAVAFEPGPKPLVDELADELCEALRVIEAYAPNHAARDAIERAIERYYKEQADEH